MLRKSAVCIALASLALAVPAAQADSSPRALPFFQDWSDVSLIAVSDDWSAVPGFVGHRGDGLVSSAGADPSAILAPGTGTPVQVIANQSNPNTLISGGVAEFELADPVVALQGSSTADAPFLLLTLDTRGWRDIDVSYVVRDLDASMDDAVQPLALQYRLGGSGDFVNLASAFVADATAGSAAGLATPVSLRLPAAAAGAALLELRFITANAAGNDEWIGVDSISLTGSPVASVPEPGEWMLMLSGLGLLGFTLRRRLAS
ncbi:MAG: hypothetical protein OHK0026_08320 [Rhodocyclaceae bacterium]